ncbi:MAG: tetratricopeptide repeat protein [Myxococcota bacterium]|nr:tetratricopeptide repeat protein [Myxococcota bacterium]
MKLTRRTGQLALVLSILLFLFGFLGCQESAEVRAQEALSRGDFQEAVDLLRPEVEKRPKDARLSATYGIALLQNQQPTLAIWPLRRAYKSLGNENALGMRLSQALIRGGASQEGLDLINELLEESPDSTALLALRARAYGAVLDREAGLEDVEKLIEMQPNSPRLLEDRIAMLIELERIEEASVAVADFQERVASGEVEIPPGGMPRFCGAQARFHMLHGEMEKSRELFEECLVKHPADADLLVPMLEMLYASGDFDRVAEVLEEQASSPLGQARLRVQLLWVEDLEVREEFERAEEILTEAAERMHSPQAWLELADFHLRRENIEAAAEALNQAVSWAQGGGTLDTADFDYSLIPEEGLFAYGDILIQTGDLDRVRLIMESIEEPVFVLLLQARLKLVEGDPRGALEDYEEAFRFWSSNAGARYLAAEAALKVGEFDTAMNHYMDSLRADAPATDAGIVLARLQLYQGLPRPALDTIIFYLQNAPEGKDRMVAIAMLNHLSMDSNSKEGSEFARELMIQMPDPHAQGQAKAGYALVLAKVDGDEAALTYLEEDELLEDRFSAQALLVWARAKERLGQADEARLRLEAALEKAPSSFELKTTLAAFNSHDPERAEQTDALFLESIAEDPDYMPSRLGRIEFLSAMEGREEEILAEWEAAARIDPKDPAFGYEAAMLLMAMGQKEEALSRLEAHLELFPWYGDSAMELAAQRSSVGDYSAESLRLARLASAFGFRDRVRARLTQGQIHRGRGEMDEAEQIFAQLTQFDPNSPEGHYYLGLVLESQGRNAAAVDSFKRALELGDWTNREDAEARVGAYESSSAPLPQSENGTEAE